MKIRLSIEKAKDATGIVKDIMIVSIETDIPGMEKLTAVAELEKGSVLEKEISQIATDILSQKQLQLKAENNHLLDKAFKKAKVGIKRK